jgi:hypothetical protein
MQVVTEKVSCSHARNVNIVPIFVHARASPFFFSLK